MHCYHVLVVMAEVTDQSVFVFCSLSYSFCGTIATNVTSSARVQELPRCSVGTELWHEFELHISYIHLGGGYLEEPLLQTISKNRYTLQVDYWGDHVISRPPCIPMDLTGDTRLLQS